MYNKVMKTGSWVKYTDKDVDGVNVIKQADGSIANVRGYNSYFVAKYKNTPSYVRIEANQKVNSKMKHNFYPSNRVIMQVVDMMDVTNKHLKILTSKDTPYEIQNKETNTTETIHFYDTGISLSLYNAICEDILDARKNWDFPIGIYKTGTMQNAYKIKDVKSDPMPDELKVIFDAVKDATVGPESEYEKYDSDVYFGNTTYQKLYTNLIGQFKQADIDTNSNFADRLIKLVEQERKELEEVKLTEVKSDIKSEVVSPPVVAPAPSVVVEPAIERKVRVVEEKKEVSLESQIETTFKFWQALEKEDKADILNTVTQVENGVITYKENTPLAICDNPNCRLMLPNTVMSCMKCGMKFA
jgi:hypothetical protein